MAAEETLLLTHIPSSSSSSSSPIPTLHRLRAVAAARLRPLWDRLSPWVERLSPLARRKWRGCLPSRSRSRWLVVLSGVTVFMMIVLTYTRSSHLGGPLGWLGSLGSLVSPGGKGSGVGGCPMLCPEVHAPDDPLWRPRAVPMEHACFVTATVPVPCVPNASRSEILEMPPIHFLPNYRNPCWYEDLSTSTTTLTTPTTSTADSGTPSDEVPAANPYYSRNLFACFSHTVRRLFLEITNEYSQRQEQEQQVGVGRGGSRRLRCLPYFYIAGMPKSGSTDLFRKVMQHPQVVRPPYKEPHWWSKNRFGMRMNYSSAISLRDYIDLFDNAALQIESRHQLDDDVDDDVSLSKGNDDVRAAFHPAVTGDGSVSTFWNNDEWWRLPENCGLTEPRFTNAQHIHRLTPSARIILILRNPIDRLFSDYLYFTKSNKSAASFHQEVMQSIDKLRECLATQTLRACSYDKQVANGKAKVRLRVGVYHVYLSEWLRVFPPDQLLVLRTEDYSMDTRHAIRHVFRFLKLRPLRRDEEDAVVQLPMANTRRLKDRHVGPMWAQTRQALREFYQPHNLLLARLLKDSRFLWNDVTTAAPAPKEDDAIRDSRTGRERVSNRVNRGKSASDSDDADDDRGDDHDDGDKARTSLKKQREDSTSDDVTEAGVSDDVSSERDENNDDVSTVMTDSTISTTTSSQDEFSTNSEVER